MSTLPTLCIIEKLKLKRERLQNKTHHIAKDYKIVLSVD